MAESLWADLDAMRASSAQLDVVADEVARLQADLAREGEFWGHGMPDLSDITHRLLGRR